MKIIITADFNSEAKLGDIIVALNAPPQRALFEAKNYGPGIIGIGIVLVCRDPKLNLKPRIRFSKKDRFLYMDIMLEIDQLSRVTGSVRKGIVLERITKDVSAILPKYEEVACRHSLGAFDSSQCIQDIKKWTETFK